MTEVAHARPSPQRGMLSRLNSENHAEHPDEYDKHVVYDKNTITEHMKNKFNTTRTSGKLHDDPKIEKLVRSWPTCKVYYCCLTIYYDLSLGTGGLHERPCAWLASPYASKETLRG